MFFFLISRRTPRSTQGRSSAASDVYKRQVFKLGLVSIPAVAMMMNFLPQPISTFMVNSDFRGIILWAVLFVLTYLIYLPFFKVYEKQELESEQEVNTLRKEEKNG